MLQVVLSIKRGKLSSSALLRKLGTYSRRNKLYQALRELGRVIRTLFLLDYISDIELREEITAETNKVEAYNGFTDWISFGNPYTVIASNDPDEHEKAIKYADIIANCVMLQNVMDISEIVMALIAEGFSVQPGHVAKSSPLLTDHIKRFGDYYVNLSHKPKDISHSFKLSLP